MTILLAAMGILLMAWVIFAQYRFTVAAKPHLQKTMLLSMQNVKAVEGFMM